MTNRGDVANFLKQRRGALNPLDVGLPPGRGRRTPGLRREEVAMLAGVSLSWYTWLEQGRPINASRSVLDAVARTLRLTAAEHEHLLSLVSGTGGGVPVFDGAPEPLVRLIESVDPSPAYVLGPRWEMLAWNRAQHRLAPILGALDEARLNLLWLVFAVPEVRALIVDWEAESQRLVAEFRTAAEALRSDQRFIALLDALRSASPEFDRLWSAHRVAEFATRLRYFDHPHAGRLAFQYQVLRPAEWPSLRVVLQLGVSDDDSVQRLAAWHIA